MLSQEALAPPEARAWAPVPQCKTGASPVVSIMAKLQGTAMPPHFSPEWCRDDKMIRGRHRAQKPSLP